jgi:hypothetical protein
MPTVVLKERINPREEPKVARKEKRTFVAKPVKGKVDYKSLRKGIMERFPDTIAYLAK